MASVLNLFGPVPGIGMSFRYWVVALALALGLWIGWNLFVHQDPGAALSPIHWLMEQLGLR
jgi:hypothetical protein